MNIFNEEYRKTHPIKTKFICGIGGGLFILIAGWSVAKFIGGMPYVIPTVAASIFLLTNLNPSKSDNDDTLRVDDSATDG